MVRMLHLADLHLGWKPSYLEGERCRVRQRERDCLLEKAVNYALDPANKIDMVLIVGDLFETHRPEESLTQAVICQLKRLEEASKFLITVPGNHDEISYHDSVYRKKGEVWPGVLVRNPMPELVAEKEIRGIGVRVYSLAYTGGLTRVNALTKFPRQDGAGLHIGAFHGSLDWDAGERSLPLHSRDLADAGYDYIALGHIHQYQEKKVASGLAVYPGAVEYKSLSDPGVGHFTVVEFKEERVSIEKPPVEVRKHAREEIDVSSLNSKGELLDACRSLRDPQAVVEIVFKGTPSFPVDAEEVSEALRDDFFYLEIKDESTFISPDLIERYAAEPTIRGEFVKRIAARMERAETEREKEVLKLALLKGLAAFTGGEGR